MLSRNFVNRIENLPKDLKEILKEDLHEAIENRLQVVEKEALKRIVAQ
jgi:hypothetical protein